MGKQGNLNHALWQVLLNMRTYLSHISARDFRPLDSIVTGLKGVAKSADTSLVHGNDLEEHDQRMHVFLTTLAEN